MHGSTSLYAVCCSHFEVVKALADARLRRARARAASLPGFIVRNSVFGLAVEKKTSSTWAGLTRAL